jgi:hypothetical protein
MSQPPSVIKKTADNLSSLCGQQISLKFGNDERQHFCICVGVSIGQFVVAQIPAVADIEQKLTPGNPTVVRFVESGMVCGFKTKVRQFILIPFRLIFFDYPDSLELINLRSSKRVPLFLNAMVRLNDKDFEGAIKNLSAGGCLFVAEFWQSAPLANLTPGTVLFISFALVNEDITVTLQGRPVKVEADKNEVRIGFAFQNNPPESIQKVSGFVDYVNQLLGNEESV